MKRLQMPDGLSVDPAAGMVYGEPHQTPVGSTVITAARVHVGDNGAAVSATPLGVMVIRGDRARWVAAVDANRIALMGVLTGMLAAVIGSLAVLRRPPWPDLRAAGGNCDAA